MSVRGVTGPEPSDDHGPMLRLARVFARVRGESAFAALHAELAPLGFRRFTVGTFGDDPSSPVRYRYHGDIDDPNPGPLDSNTLAFALTSAQPQLFAGVLQSQSGPRQRAVLAAPIYVGGSLRGFCVAQNNEPFADDALILAEFAAVLIGHRLDALQRERAENAASRARTLLLATSRTLASEADLESLFSKFNAHVGRAMDASIFWAALLTDDGRELEIAYCIEHGRPIARGMRIPMTAIGSAVIESGRHLVFRQPDDWLAYESRNFTDAPDPISAIFAPMKLGHRVIGILCVQTAKANVYSDADVDLFVAVSEQAAIAVENAANLRSSRRRSEELNLIVEVARALTSELDLRGLFAKIKDQVRRVVDAPLFMVALAGEGGTVTLEYLVEGDHEFPPQRFAIAGTIVGRVFDTHAPVLVHNVAERERLSRTAVGEGEVKVQSVAAVPLTVNKEIIGALAVQSYAPDAYGDRDVGLLSAIAEQSAVAVRNARLYEHAKLRADSDALTGLPNQQTLLERLTFEIKRAQRENGRLALLMLDVDQFKGINDSYGHRFGDAVLKMMAGSLRAVARGSDVVGRYGGDEFCAILPGADADAAAAFIERLRADVASRPVTAPGQAPVPVGLSIGFAAYPEQADTLEELIAEADSSLYADKRGERARHDADDAVEWMPDPVVAKFQSLVEIIANSGRRRNEHMRSMQRLAGKYAQAAGYDDATRALLTQAAVLVDAGELAIPNRLYAKPGRLDDLEFALMRTHVHHGIALLRGFAGGDRVALVVAQHHERLDGTGYPEGRAGDEICELGRVIAVIDAFAAMRADRPHRRALTQSEAIAELRRDARTKFDAAVVATFISAL
jgi:diguanylate cyclase (GGDEF)-like protein